MWRPGSHGDPSFTCPACGRSVTRSEAREYDKHGDRWDRHRKDFEYLCTACHDALCHQPRADLEALLVDINAGGIDRGTFLARYTQVVEEKYGPLEDG